MSGLSLQVTVLMTVYNGGGYLPLAIRSVLEQDFRDFEFLIVDDRSTDDSVKVVESFRDPRIRLHRNPENCGQTRSLNIGLELARGTYVARIDADDVALSGWLSAQVAAMRTSPGCAVATLPVVLIDPQGRVKKLQGACASREAVYLRMLTHSPFNHGGCLMKRDIVLRAGGYDNELRILADFGLWSKLALQGCSFTSSDHVGMAVRVHKGSISLASRERVRQEMKGILRENITMLTDHPVTDEELEMLWRMFYDLENFPCRDMAVAGVLFQQIVFKRKPALDISEKICQSYTGAIRRENRLRLLFRSKGLRSIFFPFIAGARGLLALKAWIDVGKFRIC